MRFSVVRFAVQRCAVCGWAAEPVPGPRVGTCGLGHTPNRILRPALEALSELLSDLAETCRTRKPLF